MRKVKTLAGAFRPAARIQMAARSTAPRRPRRETGQTAGQAIWRRDASIAYWQSINGLARPPGHSAPAHLLGYYQVLRVDK
jgi:hypothetical protein